jgi:hypothetical protein
MVDTSNDHLAMMVNLFISGRKLRDMDVFSKSDPRCVVYEIGTNEKESKIGYTEIINNNLNPDFKTTIQMKYYFEKVQKLKFVMVDDDGAGKVDVIGTVFTQMGDIMGARAQCLVADIVQGGKSNRGKMIIRAEGVSKSNEAVTMSSTW